jgi:hypothetical protein
MILHGLAHTLLFCKVRDKFSRLSGWIEETGKRRSDEKGRGTGDGGKFLPVSLDPIRRMKAGGWVAHSGQE